MSIDIEGVVSSWSRGQGVVAEDDIAFGINKRALVTCNTKAKELSVGGGGCRIDITEAWVIVVFVGA